MSQIKNRDTKPEKTVRSFLHRLGFRFRLSAQKLPGRPDVVLTRHRTVVMVHGCFWHRHPGCKLAYHPKTNIEFWNKKFGSNVARDRTVRNELRRLGWRIVVVWECNTVDLGRLETLLRRELITKPPGKRISEKP